MTYGTNKGSGPFTRTYKGRRDPRRIKGYPRKTSTLIRRTARSAIRSEYIRQPRPRLHARAWKYRTRADQDAALEARAEQNIRGSLPERLVHRALTNFGLLPGVDFTFQTAMLGGRTELGGLVADFIFPKIMTILQVQSYWHTVSQAIQVRDDDQMAILERMGYLVLEIWPEYIEDEVLLDRWVQENIMHLWGTSAMDVGTVTGSIWSYTDQVIIDNYIPTLLRWLRLISETLVSAGGSGGD